tara:strand:+ start:11415 stop:13445 length:2031 start_codon:yes stop_codon:yes gene_type:complete
MDSPNNGKIEEDDKVNHYLTALIELGDVLINKDQTRDVTRSLLRLMLGLVVAPKGAIFIYSEKSSVFFPIALQGFDYSEPIPTDTYLIQNLEFHANSFLDLKKVSQIKNNHFIDSVEELGARITVPLYFRKDPLGILFIGDKMMGEKFNNLDKNVISVISNHLVKSLHNTKLLSELDKKRNALNVKLLEQQTLFDISVAISSVLDVEKLLEDVLWRSVGVLNASKGMIVLESKNSPILKTSASFNWKTESILLSKSLDVFSLISKNRYGFVFSKKNKGSIQDKLNETNLVVSPISTKNKKIGYMILCNKETRKGIVPFSDDDLSLLTALSNQAAVAIDNAFLFGDISESKQFNESVLGSVATGVITLNELGEIDSINPAALKILRKEKDKTKGNHYMFLFEKDSNIIELIQKTENTEETQTEQNIFFKTVSEDTKVNVSMSPRKGADGKTMGVVISIEDISDVSKLKNTFKRYVSKQVVDEILDDETKLNLGGEEREITVLFSDIRGFTSMAENMNPEEVVSTLNEHFKAMIEIVFKYNGTLDKIVGDQLMIVFGAPISNKDDTKRAVNTALDMQSKVKTINKARTKKGADPVYIGIGVNKGLAVSGNIGSDERMDYTIIGDTVNLGARLCSVAKPNEILISQSVYSDIKNGFKCKTLEPIRVKGKKEKVLVYSVG